MTKLKVEVESDPLLFGLYTEQLVERFRNTGMGINVNRNVLSVLLYEDDAVLMSCKRC